MSDPAFVPDGKGGISEVRPWLENSDKSNWTLKFDSPNSLLAVLRSTPASLADLAEGIPQDQWMRCPECDEWSLNEIFCHLRDVELEVNIPRMQTLIKETNPFITGQITDDWVQQRDYDRQDGREALKILAKSRTQLVDLLSNFIARRLETNRATFSFWTDTSSGIGKFCCQPRPFAYPTGSGDNM